MTRNLLDNPAASSVPNEELTLAMQESEKMLADPTSKKFGSVHALFADLDAED